VPHVLRLPEAGHGVLGGLVGVEGALVVLPGRLVEGLGQHVGVETLQLLTEPRDVLVGDDSHRSEVVLPPLLERLPPTILSDGPDDHEGHRQDQQDHEDLHGVRLPVTRESPVPQGT
jgi:hypothetical protein